MDRDTPNEANTAWWNAPSAPASGPWYSARTAEPPTPPKTGPPRSPARSHLPDGPYPSASDYVTALQAPATALAQPELRAASPRSGMFGLPAVTTGQNAAVFTLDLTDGSTLALRAFTSKPSRGPELYAALAAMPLPDCMAPVGWFDDEITANGTQWPVVTMPWVEGLTLERWLDTHRNDPGRINALRRTFRTAVDELYDHGIAHGDLQHGNIIVTDTDEVVFVDYDGLMLFDTTTGQALTPPPTEAGHPNYQHPQRIAQGGAERYSDTFSATLIDLSLAAIAAQPDLYRADGNSLVLTAEDLDDPNGRGANSFDRFISALSEDDRTTGQLLRTWCTRTHQLPITAAALSTSSELPNSAARSTPQQQRSAPVTNLDHTSSSPTRDSKLGSSRAATGSRLQPSLGFTVLWIAGLVVLALLFESVRSGDTAASNQQNTSASNSAASSGSTEQDQGSGSTSERSEPPPPPQLEWEAGSCVRMVGDQGELVPCSQSHDAVIVRQTSSSTNCPMYYWPGEGVTSAFWFEGSGSMSVSCVAPSAGAQVMDYRIGACLREDWDGLMPVPCHTRYDFRITQSANDPSWCPDYYMEDGWDYWCLSR